ncbi:MAG: PA0069 family radical SAM protein [Flavobacteriales bacterium]
MNDDNNFIKGRGAQFNPHNRFQKDKVELDSIENPGTQYIYSHPKTIVNKVESPDIYASYSMNPYQGCEHGCIYCYARNSHEYWGYSAGQDFESKIIIKKNAPQLLEEFLNKKNYQPATIMLSGNTDCYQPVERKMKITRSLLEVLVKYRHPVGMITKNALVLRDIDLLKELAANDLVHVTISLTTLSEELRRQMEPRASSFHNRLKIVSDLSKEGIPVGILIGPVIPSLNSYEIPEILREAAEAGAHYAGMVPVRLQGAIAPIFEDWITKSFPDRAQKVLNQIKDMHDGEYSSSRYQQRKKGNGKLAEQLFALFKVSHQKYFAGRESHKLRTDLFRVPGKGGQLSMEF